MMSGKELRWVQGIRQAMEKQLTQEKAGELLRLPDRQIRQPPAASGAGRRPGAGPSGAGEAIEPVDF